MLSAVVPLLFMLHVSLSGEDEHYSYAITLLYLQFKSTFRSYDATLPRILYLSSYVTRLR